MKKEEFCEIFGDINEKYIKEARTHQKIRNLAGSNGELWRLAYVL